MKIRVGVVVKIDKKNKKLCAPNCPGLYFGSTEDGYLCTVFNWVLLKREQETDFETDPIRCRACVRNQIPMRGVK
jgi:hypothetical protein